MAYDVYLAATETGSDLEIRAFCLWLGSLYNRRLKMMLMNLMSNEMLIRMRMMMMMMMMMVLYIEILDYVSIIRIYIHKMFRTRHILPRKRIQSIHNSVVNLRSHC